MFGLVTWAHVMMRPVEPNEQMYIAASILSQDAELYRDFAFLQMPNLPLLYAGLFRLTGTEHYLFLARSLTWLFTLGTCGAIAGIAWHYTRNSVSAALAAWLMALSENFILTTGECSNYVMPMFLSLLGFWLVVCRVDRVSTLAVGILIGAAVGTKLYYAALIPAFLGMVFFQTCSRRSQGLRLVSMLTGVGIGCLPSIWHLVKNPENFMFNNLWFHWETANWFRSIEYSDRVTLLSRVRYGKSWLQHPSQMWIVFGCIAVGVRQWMNWNSHPAKTDVGLALSICGLSVVASLSPVPAWPQYFAMPIPFVLVWFLANLSDDPKRINYFLGCCVAVGVFVSGPYYVRCTTEAIHPSRWVPLAVHRQAIELFRESTAFGHRPLVATFLPLLALEAQCDIHVEFATSGFLPQMAERLTESQIQRYRTTSFRRIRGLLDSRTPDFIVTRIAWGSPGNSPSLDDSLAAYAAEHDFQRTEFADLNLVVWKRILTTN